MEIPNRIPGLKGLTTLIGMFSLAWIALEGAVWQVVTMGVGWTAVAILYLLQKIIGGRVLTGWRWWGGTAVTGLLFGLGSGILTLAFMAVKTGLHAHGPEFSPIQINWLLNQLPIWSAAGLLFGLGLGLLTKVD